MKKSVFSSPVSEASLPGRTERVLLCGVCVGLAVLSALLLFGSVGSDGMLMLSLLSCGLSLITVIRAARSLQAAIGLLLVMASGLLLAGLYTLTGIAVSLAAVTAVTAMLWTAKPNPWFLLLPLLSGGIAFVLLRSPYAVVFAILPFALAILLGEHLRRRGSRASGVCRMALVLLLLTVLMFFLHVFRSAGYLNGSLLRQVFDALRDRVADLLAQNVLKLAVPEADAALVSSVLGGVPAMVEMVFNYLPAILAIGAMLLSFWIYGLCVRLLFTAGAKKEDISVWMQIDISPYAAIVFVVALVGSAAFRFEREDFAAVVCQNLLLILLPGLLWVAMDALRSLVMTRMQSCFGTLLYVGAFLLLFAYPSYTLLIGALAGAAVLLLHHLLRKLGPKAHPDQ